MFACQICKRQSRPGEKCHKVVTERRHVNHWPGDHPGTQIVTEVNACAPCAGRTVAVVHGSPFAALELPEAPAEAPEADA